MGAKKKTIAENYEVRLSANALKNIDEIVGYISFINHQPANGIKVGDVIYEAIDKISNNPYVYKECPFLQTKEKIYRQSVCLSWLIVYKIVDKLIVILGVMHKSQRPDELKKLRRIK